MRAKCFDTMRVVVWLRRAVALVVLAIYSGLTHAVDFKGIEIGETLWPDRQRDVFRDLDCNPLQLANDDYQAYMLEMQALVPGAQKVCLATTSIATVPADVTVVLGLSRRVLRLTFQFEGANYPLVLRAMSQKWGDGIREVRGESDESVWWDFSDGSSVSIHRSPAEGEPSGSPVSIGLVEYALTVTAPRDDL